MVFPRKKIAATGRAVLKGTKRKIFITVRSRFSLNGQRCNFVASVRGCAHGKMHVRKLAGIVIVEGSIIENPSLPSASFAYTVFLLLARAVPRIIGHYSPYSTVADGIIHQIQT